MLGTLISKDDFSVRLYGRVGDGHAAFAFLREVGYSNLLFKSKRACRFGLLTAGERGDQQRAQEKRDSSHRFESYSNRCLLYTSDAADERSSVDLGGRRIIKKKKKKDK